MGGVIRLLRTARFARALRCALSFARSLTRSLAHSGPHGKVVHDYELSASISYSFSPLCVSICVYTFSSVPIEI